ncbi:MAG TPA: SDR family oxidoreductase [Cyclobacteriaceae bacterium]|jgi:NAD(P)-dependent dehydrogenase (short-subunit alcohol dehydrogenase family)|nr:SDR family oxidoreductase [Cyclobacteriaceae bacterium]
MKKLQDKTVFITGGLSGIGKACALAAASEGANVAIADLPSDKMSSVIHEIQQHNSKAIFIECDVSKFEQVERAVLQTTKIFSSLDVALNNAGIGGEANRVGDMSQQGWLNVINVNLNGVFNCMKHELTQMIKQKKGTIINMSSILGKVGFATASHYVAAKHGVLGLTKTAALEYATEGIRINAICPGFIDTPLLVKGGISDEHSEIKQIIVNLHPVKRFGTSEEIAKGFIFLASDDSSFVTGAALDMDGGYLIQ